MCESPVDAWLDTSTVNPTTGKPLLVFKPFDAWQATYIVTGRWPDHVKHFFVPCGKCFGCQKDRAWSITVRASFEARLYEHNSFITLTCADKFLDEIFPYGVHHRPWQLFAKKLRKKIGPFRFLMCAEYGSKTARPHYHAIIFGHSFTDVIMFPDGTFCSSKTIAECWPYGHIQVDPINDARVAYVAGYTLKDYQCGRDKDWYLDRYLNPPYIKWSRRPGLGYDYFARWYPSLIKRKDRWLNGEHYDQFLTTAIFGRSPRNCANRYFFDKLQLLSPELYAKIQASKENRPRDLLLEVSKLHDNVRKLMCQKYAVQSKTRDISIP